MLQRRTNDALVRLFYPWDDLDVDYPMYTVFRADGTNTHRPVAMFENKDEAEQWWRDYITEGVFVVRPVCRLTGVVWNSEDKLPENVK